MIELMIHMYMKAQCHLDNEFFKGHLRQAVSKQKRDDYFILERLALFIFLSHKLTTHIKVGRRQNEFWR
jgi:hypothetical protein